MAVSGPDDEAPSAAVATGRARRGDQYRFASDSIASKVPRVKNSSPHEPRYGGFTIDSRPLGRNLFEYMLRENLVSKSFAVKEAQENLGLLFHNGKPSCFFTCSKFDGRKTRIADERTAQHRTTT